MKARISQLRTYLRNKIAAARDAIYNLGIPIKGAAVERLLKDHSLVPTLVSPVRCSKKQELIIHYPKNVFMERLSPLGFDVFPAIIVDFMHEFELGVAKNTLKHLVRILYCVDPSKVALLNDRYILM